MAKLITEADLRKWATEAGAGPKFVFTKVHVLTPGALDAARVMNVQVVHPGQATRAVLEAIAKEVTGGPIDGMDLTMLEARVVAKVRGE